MYNILRGRPFSSPRHYTVTVLIVALHVQSLHVPARAVAAGMGALPPGMATWGKTKYLAGMAIFRLSIPA